MNYENGKICRLCLTEGEVMCPIFSTTSKNGLQGVALPQRIMSCAQIRVTYSTIIAVNSLCYLMSISLLNKKYDILVICTS